MFLLHLIVLSLFCVQGRDGECAVDLFVPSQVDLNALLRITIQENSCPDALLGGSEFIVLMQWEQDTQQFQKAIWVQDWGNGTYVADEFIRDSGDRKIEISRVFQHFPKELENFPCPYGANNENNTLGNFIVRVPNGKKIDQASLPDCIGDEKMYDGRWSDGMWLPYSCKINHKKAIEKVFQLSQSQEPFWIHFIGDSVTRGAFMEIATLLENHFGTKSLIFCTLGDNPKVIYLENSKLVITLDYGWYEFMDLDIHESLKSRFSFVLDDRCNNTAIVPEEARRIFHSEGDIYFKQPNITYYSIGSHTPRIVSPENGYTPLLESLSNAGYKGVVLNLVTDVVEWRIPERLGAQYKCRNSLRINAMNNALISALKMYNNRNKIFLGFNDRFSYTYAGRDFIHADAIHFLPQAAIEMCAMDLLRGFYLFAQ